MNEREELKLSGKSNFKGRNGYANLHRVSLIEVPGECTPIHIDFHSRHPNAKGSARLQLTGDDAKLLGNWISRRQQLCDAAQLTMDLWEFIQAPPEADSHSRTARFLALKDRVLGS